MLISKLSSFDHQNSDVSDRDPVQYNKLGIPSLSILGFNHILSFEKAMSLSFLENCSDLDKILDYRWSIRFSPKVRTTMFFLFFFYECVHHDLSTNSWIPDLTSHENLFRPWTYQGQIILRKLFRFNVQFASFPAQFPSMPILSKEAFSCLTTATQSRLYNYSDCFGRLLILPKADRELALQTIEQNPIIYLWRHQTGAILQGSKYAPPPPPHPTMSYEDLTRLFALKVRNALLTFNQSSHKGKLLAFITLKQLLGFQCSNFRLFCILFGFEITSCGIFQIEGTNQKESYVCS